VTKWMLKFNYHCIYNIGLNDHDHDHNPNHILFTLMQARSFKSINESFGVNNYIVESSRNKVLKFNICKIMPARLLRKYESNENQLQITIDG